MTTTVIPSDSTVVKDGVGISNAEEWTFSDSNIHAIQWNDITQTGTIEQEDEDNTSVPVTDYNTEVLPYENWHAQQIARQESLSSIDLNFYTVGPPSGDEYTKIERDLDTCKTEQINVQVRLANDKLVDTDPFLIREEEIGATPTEIDQYRTDVRQTRDDRINAIQSASDVSSLETLVQGFDEYTLSAGGYGGDYPFNQPAVNGTYPWPRLDYTLLRSL